jgi:hypothetical protein
VLQRVVVSSCGGKVYVYLGAVAMTASKNNRSVCIKASFGEQKFLRCSELCFAKF